MVEDRTNGDDPAFARARAEAYTDEWQEGLTKREYFAAKAMQGLIANPSTNDSFGEIAKNAVFMTDALIEQLNK